MKKIYTFILFAAIAVNVMAVDIPSGTKLYIQANEHFGLMVGDTPTRLAAYFWGGDGSGSNWADASTLVEGTSDWYELTVPGSGSWSGFLFARMPASDPNTSWDNQMGQSKDLSYDGVNTCFSAISWDNSEGKANMASLKLLDEPIIVKVKVIDAWTNTISFFSWVEGSIGGRFLTPQNIGDNVYSHKFIAGNINLIVVNGTGWSGQNADQTEDINNITSSVCYQVSTDLSEGWKLLFDVVDCNEITTSIDKKNVTNTQVVYVENTTIRASFEGNAQVELFSITGTLLHSEVAKNNFNYSVEKGIYLLRINGKTNKVLVK